MRIRELEKWLKRAPSMPPGPCFVGEGLKFVISQHERTVRGLVVTGGSRGCKETREPFEHLTFGRDHQVIQGESRREKWKQDQRVVGHLRHVERELVDPERGRRLETRELRFILCRVDGIEAGEPRV